MSNCLHRYVPEMHVGSCWDVKNVISNSYPSIQYAHIVQSDLSLRYTWGVAGT